MPQLFQSDPIGGGAIFSSSQLLMCCFVMVGPRRQIPVSLLRQDVRDCRSLPTYIAVGFVGQRRAYRRSFVSPAPVFVLQQTDIDVAPRDTTEPIEENFDLYDDVILKDA